MSRHQLQPTWAATAMCAKLLRFASTASHRATCAEWYWLASASFGLFHSTSTGSGTAPSCSVRAVRSSAGNSAFGTRSVIVFSRYVGGFVPCRHEDTACRGDVTSGAAGASPSGPARAEPLLHHGEVPLGEPVPVVDLMQQRGRRMMCGDPVAV